MVPSLLERIPLDADDVPNSIYLAASDEAQDFIVAISVLGDFLHLNEGDHPSCRVARPILQRAQLHLANRLQKYLIPKHSPETEAHARELIAELATELQTASKHLHDVAGWFQAKGFAGHYMIAKQAAQRALKATEGLVD